MTRIEILANIPNNRHKDALKYYKAWLKLTELSFIIIVGHIMDAEEGKWFDW
jgi:hypothetical protein